MAGKPRKITSKELPSGCHVCTSHGSNGGRPNCHQNGKYRAIVRILWERKHGGRLPSDVILRHSCDNPWCVNLDHVSPGTHADNVKDRVRRNRTARGEGAGQAKLTEVLVREIRQLTAAGLSCYYVSKFYGMNRSTIEQIAFGRTWTHVKVPEGTDLSPKLRRIVDGYSGSKRSRPMLRKHDARHQAVIQEGVGVC